jgi:hypothetical protein
LNASATMSLPRSLVVFFGLACALAASPTTPLDPARQAPTLSPSVTTVQPRVPSRSLGTQVRWGQGAARRATKFQAALGEARAASVERAQAYRRAVRMETCNQFVPTASRPCGTVRAGSGAKR